MDTFPIHPLSRTICEHQRVRLPGGWSGMVMTGCAGGEQGADPDRPWPTLEQWRDWLVAMIRDPVAVRGYESLKESGKGKVFRARFDMVDRELAVVCKQTVARGWARRVWRVLRKPKVRIHFDLSLGLLRARIRTPLPLAYVVRGIAKREAWSITEFVEGAADLDLIALSLLPRIPPERQRFVRDGIVEAMGELFDHLEMNHVLHRDLKASNVVLTDWDKGAQDARAWLIDLEGVRLGKDEDEERQWRAIVRLTASLMQYRSITRTDFVRFLQAVLACWGSSPTTWRTHFHRVAVAARQYLAESKQRKRGKLDGYVDGI